MSEKHFVDICFGKEEDMLDWAKRENLELIKDKNGENDWIAIYSAWSERERKKQSQSDKK